MRQGNAILYTNKDKGKTTEASQIQIQTEASQLHIMYQTKGLTTWFLNLPLDEYIDNTKAQSLNLESKTHEAQLEDQKPRKAKKCHLEEGKTAMAANGTKSDKLSIMAKES
jgi:hypothetical protein